MAENYFLGRTRLARVVEKSRSLKNYRTLPDPRALSTEERTFQTGEHESSRGSRRECD